MERNKRRREVCETCSKLSDPLLKRNDVVTQVTDELCSHCEHAEHYVTHCIQYANKGLTELIIFLRVVMPMSRVRFLQRPVSNMFIGGESPKHD